MWGLVAHMIELMIILDEDQGSNYEDELFILIY